MRYADGKPERLPALAAELVHANVDVTVMQDAQPIEAARNATGTIVRRRRRKSRGRF
jgi:putative ABC transport system substrate-binding protein